MTSPGLLDGLAALMRGGSTFGALPPDPMAAVAESLSSEPVQALVALGPARQRAEAIAHLIALLGVDEARAQATALSSRAAAEGQDLFNRAWKYSEWEHVLLHAAVVIQGEQRPILPEEVDAVHRALDEILSLDRFLAMGFRNAQSTAAAMRADPGSRTRRAGPKIRDAEARRWLARKTPSVLSSNRFGTTAKGQEFVEELYAAGAAKVVVPGESIEPDSGDGFAHADELCVHLPNDPDARRRVLGIVNREVRHEGFDEVADTGQEQVRLWWD